MLSRGFVRRALELPPLGLESELQWFYYNKKILDKILRDSSLLIERSKSDASDDADSELGIPRLTGGGIISLERTLSKLRAIAATATSGGDDATSLSSSTQSSTTP